MSTAEKKAIASADLSYSIIKLIEDDGSERSLQAGVQVLPGSRDPSTFFMLLPGKLKPAENFPDGRIVRICYQVKHRPTKTVSPIYDHKFSENPVHSVGRIFYLGPMALYPAEQVWPELTRQGYYGELPQFFT